MFLGSSRELMVQRHSFTIVTAFSLLGLFPIAFGHGPESHAGDLVRAGMSGGASHTASMSNITMNSMEQVQPSYFSHSGFSGLMLAHIVSMTIAWFFILPIGELRCSAPN